MVIALSASLDIWVGGINYYLTDDTNGARVLAAYSVGRWVLPGERVVMRCEFGLVNDGRPVTFLGRTNHFYAYETAEGRRVIPWQVRPEVCEPA